MDGVYIKAGLKEGEAVVLVVMPTLSGGSGVSQRGGHQRHHLVARVRPPRGIAQVEALPDEFGQAEIMNTVHVVSTLSDSVRLSVKGKCPLCRLPC